MKIQHLYLVLFLSLSCTTFVFIGCTSASENNKTAQGKLIDPSIFREKKAANRNEILAALKTGDVPEIIRYCAQEVYLVLPPQIDDDFSKVEAQKRLAAFFKINPIVDFKPLHEGSSAKGTSFYITGTLQTEKKNYRLHIVIEKELISEFKIT